MAGGARNNSRRFWADNLASRLLLRVLKGISARLNTMVSFWLVVLLYVILGLLEVSDLGARICRPTDGNAARIIGGFEFAASRIRRYLLIRTLPSGLATAFGLRFAAEWGIFGFTLNYIPFIGPGFATLLPTCYALAQFQSPQSALVVFACLTTAQFVIGELHRGEWPGTLSAYLRRFFSVFSGRSCAGYSARSSAFPSPSPFLSFCTQFAATRWIAELLGKELMVGGA